LTPYIVAQILCALSGATLVWLHFPPHRMLTEDAGLKLACFRNFASNLSSKIIGTLALVFGLCARKCKPPRFDGYF
jgi:glycerol uptake facilitator protein